MQINKRSRRSLKQQNIIFYLLLSFSFGLIAWLGEQHNTQLDISWNQNNTLTETSKILLSQITDTIEFDAYFTGETPEVKSNLERILSMYHTQNPNIKVNYVDISSNPGISREAGINSNGEVVIKLGDKFENIFPVNEQTVSKTLQKLFSSKSHQITFLGGHNERDLFKQENYQYSQLRSEFIKRGIQTQTLNIATEGEIPESTELLVIADPRATPIAGEVEKVLEYLDRGGNLLWLTEPNSENEFDILAEHLGLELLPGTIVDLNTQLLGINDPRFALIAEYPPHPITRDFNTLTIFPEARALEQLDSESWDAEPLLETLPRTWTETDLRPNEELSPDIGSDIQGPLVLSYTLTRSITPYTDTDEEDASEEGIDIDQRVVVIGDADFASNAYLGQAGNLDLALNIVNWLTREDQLIQIPARIAPDSNLQLSPEMQTFSLVFFIFCFPGLIAISGWIIWRKRKNA